MPTNADIVAGILESIAATAVLVPIAYFVKWVTDHPITYVKPFGHIKRTYETPAPTHYPVESSLSHRITWLQECASGQWNYEAAPGPSDLVISATRMLQSLAFFRPGDELPFSDGVLLRNLVLEEKLGDGELHQTWKAYDAAASKSVAIKFLKQLATYTTSVETFKETAHILRRLSLAGSDVPASINNVADASNLPPYFVQDFVDGQSLRTLRKVAVNPADRLEILVQGMVELAESITVSESEQIVNTSITPDNIIVRKHGGWRLVDFDHAIDLRRKTYASTGPSVNVRYVAPEILSQLTPTCAADTFSLARIILFFLWPDEDIPSPFAQTSSELIDRINCGYYLKRVLRKATCPNPSDRYSSAKQFADDVKIAIRKGGSHSPIIALFLDESEKVWRLLGHCFWGTTVAMLVARPFFAIGSRHMPFGLVQLSNRYLVGAFHGVIGGLVWGTLIPGAFLLYWTSDLRSLSTSRIWVAFFCCTAGFIGGLICALGAVLITNATTLHQLGWLLSADDQMGNWSRFSQTIIETRMFFAFPLTGALTGLAAGLFLDHGMRTLLGFGTEGLEPLPSKVHRKDVGTVFSSMSFVLTPSPWLLLLLLPMAASVGVVLLKAVGVPKSAEMVRGFGEGMVHMFGLIGLLIGFFYGIISPPSKDSRWTHFLAATRKKLSRFSNSEKTIEMTAATDA
jgi:hypothetical protein